MAVDLPIGPGTYGLLFYRPRDGQIKVGQLGQFRLPAGFYLYVGSALGSGGLAGRLRRHMNPDKHTHWHVDYLSEEALLLEIWITTGEERLEHLWAAAAAQLPKAMVLVARFGASDCHCPANLFFYGERPVSSVFHSLLVEQGVTEPVSAMLIAAKI